MADHNDKSGHRTTAIPIVVATLTLLQGTVYGIFSGFAILIHLCKISITKNVFGILVYFIYFKDKRCARIDWSLLNADIPEDLREFDLEMPQVTDVASRHYAISLSYLAMSILWLLTSLVILASIASAGVKWTSRCSCFYVWIIVIFLGCVLDIVATYFHVLDIINTKTPDETWNYLQIQNGTEILEYIKQGGITDAFILPSIIMTCLSSRLVVIFFVNLSGIVIVLRLHKRLSVNKNSAEIDVAQTEYHKQRTKNGDVISTSNASQLPLSSSLSRIPSMSRNPLEQHLQHYPTLPSKKSGAILQGYEPHLAYTSDVKNRLKVERQPSSSSQNSWRRRNRSRNSDRSEEMTYQAGENVTEDIDLQRPHSTTKPPDELRGQLPWSYFHARDNFQRPKHTLMHNDDDDLNFEAPPIPVPDYTLHFPKKDRPSVEMQKVSSQRY